MLTLDRTRHSSLVFISQRHRLAPVVLLAGCLAVSPTFAQDHTGRSAETSILIDADAEESDANDAKAFSGQVKMYPVNGRDTEPGFLGLKTPTEQDFTDTSERGSKAIGTFAHETREPRDQFDAPQPPAFRPRVTSDRPAPAQATERNSHQRRPAPITQNSLRSSQAPPSVPKTDSMTLRGRMETDRPAPPARMPSADRARFNSQLYSRQQEPSRSLPVHVPANETRPVATADQTPAIPNRLMQPLAPQRQPQFETRETTPPMVDSQVATTSFAQPVAAQNRVANTPNQLAESIVGRYSIDNTSNPLPGEPYSLTEMLQQPIPVQSRRPMISQYWETWFDWASSQNAIAYKEWLETIPATSSPGEKGLLDAALSAAKNQVLAAEIQLGKSQSKLIQFMPTRRSQLAPLPSDTPLVERYETHYELYRARNMLPANLQGIDQMLPQTLKLIEQRAQTVQMSQAAIKQTLAAYSGRQTPLASVLEAARVWRVAEQDLLASVTNYNQAIADYALNVTRRYTTPEQTAAMLIGKPKIKTQQPAASVAQNQGFDRSRSSGNSRSFNQGNTSRPAATPAGFDRNRSINQSRSATNNGTSSQPAGTPAWGRNPTDRTASSSSALLPQTGRRQADSRPSLGTSSRSTSSSNSGLGRSASPPSTNFNRPSTNPTTKSNTTGNSAFGSLSASRRSPSATGGSPSNAASASSPRAGQPTRKPLPPRSNASSSNQFGFGK